jgi:transglutaminase-like putative cysteine protease
VPVRPVWTFYFEPGVSRYLPLTGEFALLQLREARMLRSNRAATTLALRMEPQSMFAYRVEGLDLTGELGDPGVAAALRLAPRQPLDYPHTLLAVPQGGGDAAALDEVVQEITGGQTLTAAEFSRRTVGWLERRHRYSMRSTVPAGSDDVLVRWLRSDAPGHCELFAGGFTLLARRAGFPVRVVTGFKGGAWNSFEQYFMVRNSDAHAWCEIHDERGRWVRVDPTPGATAEADAASAAGAGRATEIDSSWTARLDALRMLWYRRIVNFDRDTQAEIADTLKAATRRTGQALIEMTDRWGRGVRDWFLRPWGFRRSAKGAAALAFGLVAVWATWRWRYRWWLRWTRRGRGDPVRLEAGRWLRRLTQAELPAEARPVVDQLARLRFGPVAGRPPALPVFRQAKQVWRMRR